MYYLLLVSVIWGFSFGLIKGNLAGVPSSVVSFYRLILALIVFLPFYKNSHTNLKTKIYLIIIGIVQYGLMYYFYLNSFKYLPAWQVALFTILTPIYVTIINDIILKKVNYVSLIAALIAVAGALIIKYQHKDFEFFFQGFIYIQASNICFALGQVAYKKIIKNATALTSANSFALLYLGGVIATGIMALSTQNLFNIVLTQKQVLTIVYLGIVASGAGFFLWNMGVLKTKISNLAVMNNLKIPIAILCSIVFFKESANYLNLAIGSIIMIFALILNSKNKL